MYPDGARWTSAERQPRFLRAGAATCVCHGCARRDLRGPQDPRGHNRHDGPPAPGPRPLVAERAEDQRSPQRRPVFTALQGPYPDLPGYLSPGRWDPWDSWGPWDRRGRDPVPRSPPAAGVPEQLAVAAAAVAARHYASVPEQCGCVSLADGRGRPFNGGPPRSLPPPPPEVGGQGDSRRGSAAGEGGNAGEEEEEEEEVEEEEFGAEGRRPSGVGREPRGPDRRRVVADRPGSPPAYPHVPNGQQGRRGCSETRERREERRGWGWKEARAEEGGYSSPGASHGGFFATEVPQKHLNHGRRTGPRAASSGSATRSREPSGGGSLGPERPRVQASDPARLDMLQGSGTVHDQIRQVVSNLEDVLGGLKQVHLEMKEVVDHIDRLTANMDLGEEESLAVTPVDEPAATRFLPRPADLGLAAATPHHRPPSLQNCVFLRTNAPSPVHVASVVKTNRVPPPLGQVWDGTGRKMAPSVSNGHLPHLCPPRYSDLQDPWRRAPDPKVGNGGDPRSPGPRTQKPPPYPQNGRCGKGQAPPPPVPVKTQTPYPGRRRQNTSMV